MKEKFGHFFVTFFVHAKKVREKSFYIFFIKENFQEKKDDYWSSFFVIISIGYCFGCYFDNCCCSDIDCNSDLDFDTDKGFGIYSDIDKDYMLSLE